MVACPNYQSDEHVPKDEMKRFYVKLFLFFFLILAVVSVSSCNNHEDPDFPVYATYQICFDENSFIGPDQMKKDIDDWIKDNSITFDEFVSSSNSGQIDYSMADSIALVTYDERFNDFQRFAVISLFKLFLKEYGEDRNAKVSYTVSAIRIQGGNSVLASRNLELKFP